MVCDMCGRRSVSVFIKTDGGNLNLCESCAALYNDYLTAENPLYDLMDLFGMAFDGDDFQSVGEYGRVKERVCPYCGTSESQLVDRYKFGCAKCYEVFADRAADFVKDLRGGEYRGKYAKIAASARKPRRLSEMTTADLPLLYRLMEDASSKRDYDRAGAINKKIKQLEGGK